MKLLTSLWVLLLIGGSVLLGVGISWLSARAILRILNHIRNSKK
jgi:hypothetical protein